MFTTDLALKMDPIYGPISKRFYENPKEFEKAFAKAWYKLIHRDMGPHVRCLGPWVAEPQVWQDPVPDVDHKLIDEADVATLKKSILDTGLSVRELVSTAWASASTYRGSDMRGGANGARIRLVPQKDWQVNEPDQLAKVLDKLEAVQAEFNSAQSGGKKVSLADVIVLAGCAGIEKAAKAAGHDVTVPFTPGRTDATQEMTDVESFELLEPQADGFRNYESASMWRSPEEMLVDRANLLSLTAPEMTVLVGGLRVLDTNFQASKLGVLTSEPGKLSNDFFANLLETGTEWKPIDGGNKFEGFDRASGDKKWTASRVDLVFGSNAQLRAIAEVYASADSEQRFVDDFVAAWTKVMNLDRFDLDRSGRESRPAVAVRGN
jgi:catalase-peroxidase